MPWLQIKLSTTANQAELWENHLLAAGASAVTLQDAKDQPVFEPAPGSTPLWHHTTVIGLFPAHADTAALLTSLKQQSGQTPLPAYTIDLLEDQVWETAWLQHCRPRRFGKRLWVCPSEQPPPEPAAVNVLLTPGLAFGTGTHPTTALCLTWLEQQPLAGSSLVDYGCGSGILAIAACLLGATAVTGVDIDPQALMATQDNAQRNGLPATQLSAVAPAELSLSSPVDRVVANILVGPLITLAPQLAALVAPAGQIALSGILADQVAALQAAYAPWFALAPPWLQDDWALLVGQRHVTTPSINKAVA